jgi:hypothetical protein
MIVIADTGAATIARPVALDAAERFLNEGFVDARRALALKAIVGTGLWCTIAEGLDIPSADLDCFLSDMWGDDDRDVFLHGIAEGLTLAMSDDTIRFETAVATKAHVDYRLEPHVFTIILCAPGRRSP